MTVDASPDASPRKPFSITLGRAGMGVGAIVIAAVLAYVAFAAITRGQSAGFQSEVSPAERTGDLVAPTLPPDDSAGAVGVSRYTTLYPGGKINPRYWADPVWAGDDPYSGPLIPDHFQIVPRPGFGAPAGSLDIPVRLRVPAINLDVPVSQLEVILGSDGDPDRYENPDRVAGQIPGTANPGENGNGWYFGHLSNFGTNEGNVFHKVPQIFDRMKEDPVYVFIDTATGSYAYQVFGTDVVSRDDLKITGTGDATITLVASWPPLVFDQRFLIFAELVGVSSG